MASQFSPPPPPHLYTAKHPATPSDLTAPPAKRPRLSPGPGQQPISYPASPYALSPGTSSPTVAHLSLPVSTPPIYSFNAPQPVQPVARNVTPLPVTGVMGPPQRPSNAIKQEDADKPVDPNDALDMVVAAGIDLREEENYLAATYRNRQNEPGQGMPFAGQQPYVTTPSGSFQTWSQGSYGSQVQGFSSQATVSQKSVEEELEEKHKLAARSYAEAKSKHAQSPFLYLGTLRRKLNDKSFQNQVKFTADGRMVISDPPKYHSVAMVGQDNVGVVQGRASSMVHSGSPLEEMLCLLSLAANEHLRTVLDESIGVARSRRYGSQGVVPPEWSSIATGKGEPTQTTAIPQSITGTAWDQPPQGAVSPKALVPDTKASDPPVAPTDPPIALPTPPSSEALPQPTISFKPPLPLLLREIGSASRLAEEKRLALRKKRAAEKERREKALAAGTSDGADGSPADSAATAAGGAGTPGTPMSGSAAPTAAGTPSSSAAAAAAAAADPPKITKKEREKAAKLAVLQTDEVARQQANAAANMALGGFSKKYSWMNAGAGGAKGGAKAGAGGGGGFGTGVGAGKGFGAKGLASSSSSAAGAAAAQQKSMEEKGLASGDMWKKIGRFREDGPGGKGVQLRDVAAVLERDGGGARSLARAYVRLGREKEGVVEETK